MCIGIFSKRTFSEVYTMPKNSVYCDQKFSAVVASQNENSDIEISTIFVMLCRRINIPRTYRGGEKSTEIFQNLNGEERRIIVISAQIANLSAIQQSDHF